MARARNIKPGFFANEKLGELEPRARLLFVGLWTLADREGRLEDRPRRIRAQLFGYEDTVDVDHLLNLLVPEFIQRYEIAGERYIVVLNWSKHQKPHHMELPSQIPPPPGVVNRYNHKPINKAQRLRIMERDGSRCKACGSDLDLCIDHIKPVSRGGTSEDDNLQVLCALCNGGKGNRELSVDDLRSKREQVDNESNTSRDQSVETGLCPTDSLNLIADSGNPIHLDDELENDRVRLVSKKTVKSPWDSDFDFEEWFEIIWAAHPNRRYKQVAQQTLAVQPQLQDPVWRNKFTASHSAWSATDRWTWNNGAGCPLLSEWINDGGFNFMPQAPIVLAKAAGAGSGNSLADRMKAHREEKQRILGGSQ